MMKVDLPNLTFNENGLIPAIVQDNTTGKVLMLAYMNNEALDKTVETKETWFFSRSRQELWNKGATSGNKQKLKDISYDCDQDALLIQVEHLGPACLTGDSFFFYQILFQEDTQNIVVIQQ